MFVRQHSLRQSFNEQQQLMTSLISDETDYTFSDICKSDDKWVHDGNWVSHPTTYL